MPEPNITAPEPSIAELRIMTGNSPAPEPAAKTEPVEAPAPEPTTETPDPKTDEAAAPGPVEGETKQADPGPAATEPEAVEDTELPDNVKKRIAKEVEKTSRIQREIDTVVSTRKAKEAELAKVTADKPGSEPVPTTAPAATEGKPVRPDINTFPGTYAEFKVEEAKYDAAIEAYLIAKTREETERTVTEQLTARQREETLKRDWDAAIAEHGADFPALMQTLAAGSTEDLQKAISGLDDWSKVAVHLAKTPDELSALAAKFAANPYAAVAELGRLEARLQTSSKPPEPAKVPVPAKAARTLPPPPAKVGGAATASPSIDLETADQGTFNRAMKVRLNR